MKTIKEIIKKEITKEILDENMVVIHESVSDLSSNGGASCPACGYTENITWCWTGDGIEVCNCPRCVSLTLIEWDMTSKGKEFEDKVTVYREEK